jgi:hypothetical protein
MRQEADSLPLTDENLRLVNLYLLSKIKEFKPKGMKGVFDNLDTSFKWNGLFDYEAMRKAIKRDLKDLQKLKAKPEELKNWLHNQKNSQKLQIRINGDQFLQNNIFKIIGISFEDLFDKDNLPGEVEVPIEDEEIDDGIDDSKQGEALLQEINAKLDTIIEKYAGDKIRITYMNRFFDLTEYIFIISNNFLKSFYNPIECGFTNKDENGKGRLMNTKEIYGAELIFIHSFMDKLRQKKYPIRILLNKRFLFNSDIELPVKRMLSPFFLIGILEQLLINFIRSGIRNNKSIFSIMNKNMFDFSRKPYDTKILLDKVVMANTKTISFINHVLDSNIKPDDNFCIECEKLFVEFVNNISSLFQLLLPILLDFRNIYYKPLKEMETEINDLFKPGKQYSFGIRIEQVEYFDTFINKIEEIQIGLEQYYAGNVDVDVDEEPPRAEIGFTPT